MRHNALMVSGWCLRGPMGRGRGTFLATWQLIAEIAVSAMVRRRKRHYLNVVPGIGR